MNLGKIAALICSCALVQIAHAIPTASFNSFSFTQQTFNFNGTQTTVVGHLAAVIHILDPDGEPDSDYFFDLLNTGPAGMTVTPGSQHLILQGGDPPCASGDAFNFTCTFAANVSFVGNGNGFGGGLFNSAGTLSFDNATLGNPVLATASSQFTGSAPTPSIDEPVSLALLGAGLAGLVLMRARRQA